MREGFCFHCSYWDKPWRHWSNLWQSVAPGSGREGVALWQWCHELHVTPAQAEHLEEPWPKREVVLNTLNGGKSNMTGWKIPELNGGFVC